MAVCGTLELHIERREHADWLLRRFARAFWHRFVFYDEGIPSHLRVAVTFQQIVYIIGKRLQVEGHYCDLRRRHGGGSNQNAAVTETACASNIDSRNTRWQRF